MKLEGAPTPIRGDRVEPLAVEVAADLAARAKAVGQLRSVDVKALEELADRYVRDVLSNNTIFGGQRLAPMTMLEIDLGAARRGSAPKPAEEEQLGASLARRVAGAGMELAKLWADGLVHEREVAPLKQVLGTLDTILEMKEDRRLAMAGRDVSPKIEAAFQELSAMAQAARSQLTKLEARLDARDLRALEERLADPTPIYKTVDPVALGRAGLDLSDLRRYQPGDLVVLGSEGRSVKLGIVAGEEDGKLRVATTSGGARQLRLVDAEALARDNPLKIGDHVELDGRQLWVRPSPSKGVVAEERDGIQLRSVDVGELAKALAAQVARGAMEAGVPGRAGPPEPKAQIFVAAGAVTNDVERLASRVAGGAAISSLGPASALNDDAIVLATLRRPGGGEVIVAGVADELGGAPRGVKGGASAKAAELLLAAGEEVARGRAPSRDALARVVREADAAVAGTGLTTLTGAILEPAPKGGLDAQLVHVGDSIAWRFSSRGRLLDQTTEHNLGRAAADASGDPNANPGLSMRMSRALGDNASGRAEEKRLHLDPGDFLVFVTHGVSQANLRAQQKAAGSDSKFSVFHSDLTAKHVGALVAQATSAEDAARRIREYTLGQMVAGDGRPENNLSVVVVEAPR